MIEPKNECISVKRQMFLLDLPRSTFKYEARGESNQNQTLMRLLDNEYSRTPFYGVLKWKEFFGRKGFRVNEKRIRRLKNKLGLRTLFPRRKWRGTVDKESQKHPYLLRDMEINKPNQVWSTDITYIKLDGRSYYLTAILDWYSRYVVGWEISKSMGSDFCQTTLMDALRQSSPEIFNSDQGSQYTATGFVNILKKNRIAVSMDGKGRCFDNIRMERFWRSIKCEEIYLKEYNSFVELKKGIGDYIEFYNRSRFHQNLGYRTPAEVYYEGQGES